MLSIFHRATLISQALIWCSYMSLTEPVRLPHPQGGPLIKSFVLHGTSWGARAANSNELKRLAVSDYINILQRSHSLLIPCYSWSAWLQCHLIFVIGNFFQLGYGEAELAMGSCKAARWQCLTCKGCSCPPSPSSQAVLASGIVEDLKPETKKKTNPTKH